MSRPGDDPHLVSIRITVGLVQFQRQHDFENDWKGLDRLEMQVNDIRSLDRSGDFLVPFERIANVKDRGISVFVCIPQILGYANRANLIFFGPGLSTEGRRRYSLRKLVLAVSFGSNVGKGKRCAFRRR